MERTKTTTLAERRQALRKLDTEATRWFARLTRAHNALVRINRQRKALNRKRKPVKLSAEEKRDQRLIASFERAEDGTFGKQLDAAAIAEVDKANARLLRSD